MALILVIGNVGLLAQSGGAMLTSQGNVNVNGKPVPDSTAIFEGDKIQTGANSAAKITAEGLDINVPQNSTLAFSSQNIDVGCGVTSVFSKAGRILRLQDGTTIAPNGGEGFNKIEIAQNAGKAVVTVTSGSALVTQGTQTATVNAGYRLDLAGAGCGAPPTVAGTPQAPPAAGAGAEPAASGTAHVSHKLVPILIVAGGAGALAGILLTRGEEKRPPVTAATP